MSEIKDISDISISSEASAFVEAIFEQGLFKNRADILSIAAAYTLKHHHKTFEPAAYILKDAGGLNYGYSTFDADGKWSALIRGLYPECTTPRLYLRALMDKGLLLIAQRMRDDVAYSIIDEL